MGYTHYWKNKEAIPPEVWLKIRDDADKLIAASPVPIQWESDDKRPPEVNRAIDRSEKDEALIRFNGVDDDGHETFYMTGDLMKFEFCKTAYKPYDVVVTAMLAMIQSHWPAFWVSSDGDENEWRDGLVFASKTLSRVVTIKLDRD